MIESELDIFHRFQLDGMIQRIEELVALPTHKQWTMGVFLSPSMAEALDKRHDLKPMKHFIWWRKFHESFSMAVVEDEPLWSIRQDGVATFPGDGSIRVTFSKDPTQAPDTEALNQPE